MAKTGAYSMRRKHSRSILGADLLPQGSFESNNHHGLKDVNTSCIRSVDAGLS